MIPRAGREIEAALAADDPELASSFVDLARGQGIADPDLARRIEAANFAMARSARAARSFAHGFVTREPQDAAGFADTTVGDLLVFGDIRDALREGRRLASGEEADEMVLGLACIGLAVTAGTYALLGASAPARVGVSLVKGARKTGRPSGPLAAAAGNSLREAVDLSVLRRAVSSVSLAQPVTAVRAARVQAKAGTRAAMDGLAIAKEPKDMARVARLAEAKGGKTRAILKLGGRAAIALTTAVTTLLGWAWSGLLAVLSFCAAVKGLTERLTRRWLAWRKARRVRVVLAP